MNRNETIPVDDVVNVIRKAQEQERSFCDRFCALNSDAANVQRRRDCMIFVNALNTVLYELHALNG
jgi:hypothetical protein